LFTALLPSLVVAGLTATTDAGPIRFDNPPGPGHFDWRDTVPGSILDGTTLSVLLPADSQSNDLSNDPGSFNQVFLSQGDRTKVVGEDGQAGTTSQLQHAAGNDFFLVGVDEGVMIPDGLPWRTGNPGGWILFPPDLTELPEGAATYLGVRFDPGDGLHHGWIGVVRTGLDLDAFAWGYETVAGVPIAAGVPEPATLSLLSFGAIALLRRRT
jgi:hypothetical protein